jgi:branched-chain amino acid transport system ATP-binding protein
VSEALLEVVDLVAGYEPDLPILKGASLHAAAREIVVLLGPNGAGKSTLIKAIAGIVPASAGRVLLAGEEITRLPAHRMTRHRLGFVPQTDNVFNRMTVEENLVLAGFLLTGAARRGRSRRSTASFPISRASAGYRRAVSPAASARCWPLRVPS